MTEVQIRDAMKSASTYPELMLLAQKLKAQGAKETTLNRCLKDRRNQLLKGFKNLPKIITVPFDNALIKNDNPFIGCSIVTDNIYGCIIEAKGNSIILR